MNSKELLKHLINASSKMAKAALEAREYWFGKVEGKELESKIDYASVNTLKAYLSEHDLTFKVISEEGFEVGEGEGEYLIVDPVDGTSNMCRGIPFTAISLAISKGDLIDDVYIGVVRDIFRDRVYWAIKNEGAYLDGKRIYVSKPKPLQRVFLSISITKASCGKSKVLNLLPLVRYPRYLGSASLELCFVASGVLDAFIDIRGSLRTFDIAAGQLIVKEAGGIVSILQHENKNVYLSKISGIAIIAASNKELLDNILAAVSQ